MRFHTSEFDIIYLSYDEPRADEFYQDLLSKCPRAKRVHGVKGFDTAHKACANLSETERFVTVDADNLVDPRYFDLEFEVKDSYTDGVFSWGALNAINGLLYGNGGLKCWPKQFVLDMRTHENADDENAAVDFCWDAKYFQLEETYCTTYPNGSPFQSFRAGFREGVKMTLDRGELVDLDKINDRHLWHGNIKRLEIWATVGSDVENGLWSVYGTRLGAYMTNMTDWNHDAIADYDWFKGFWNEEIGPQFEGGKDHCSYMNYTWDWEKLWTETVKVGRRLRRGMGLNLGDLREEDSRWFKHVYVAPSRSGYR